MQLTLVQYGRPKRNIAVHIVMVIVSLRFLSFGKTSVSEVITVSTVANLIIQSKQLHVIHKCNAKYDSTGLRKSHLRIQAQCEHHKKEHDGPEWCG
jgi:hypothetical protein